MWRSIECVLWRNNKTPELEILLLVKWDVFAFENKTMGSNLSGGPTWWRNVDIIEFSFTCAPRVVRSRTSLITWLKLDGGSDLTRFFVICRARNLLENIFFQKDFTIILCICVSINDKCKSDKISRGHILLRNTVLSRN